ncbi:hypothetical protein [Streptomyces sp. NPDC051662]|uniref:hypothetical protein n=1 Tax=Streptomyces sp. NPDC051662 TaxID=3154750 RepID=UPI00343D3A56
MGAHRAAGPADDAALVAAMLAVEAVEAVEAAWPHAPAAGGALDAADAVAHAFGLLLAERGAPGDPAGYPGASGGFVDSVLARFQRAGADHD